MQLWAAARQSVSDSTLPLLHKTYLNLFFFGVRMLATNVISFTFYSVLVPLMLLEYAQEEQLESLHHRFMPWWAIVWLPLLVTMSTMAFSPNSFHYMVLYVMYENAMSILKLGASLEGLLGLKGSMTWTVTQKLGGQSRTLSFSSVLAQLSFFQREMYAGVSLIGAAVYGLMLGTSWVFTVYFFTQGIVFVIFSLSLVEAFNLQPPSEEDLLGVATAGSEAARPLALEAGTAHLDRKPRRKSRTQLGGIQINGDLGGGARSNGSDEGEVSTEEEDAAAPIAIGGKRAPSVAPPPLWRVLRANVVIFLYTLPINAFSIVLLYGLVTMGLSETIHTQWDDIVALSLSLVLVPLHMCWSLGNARRNWEDRRLARNGRLPRSRKLLQLLQLCILYLLLFLLLLVSMYSASATLQARVLPSLEPLCQGT